MEDYEHTQIGYIGAVIVALVAAVILLVSHSWRAAAFGPPFLLVIGVIVMAFSRMTVRVANGDVSWGFTWGFPSGRLALGEIERAEIVRTSFLEGYGIHLSWHGWLWNVAGFNAVELYRVGKSPITLGTDDPQGLYAAITRAKAG